VSHCYFKDLKKYSNRKWTVEFQGDESGGRYIVTDNKTKEKYYVHYYFNYLMESQTWTVYKKETQE
jgi:hypothetical protein